MTRTPAPPIALLLAAGGGRRLGLGPKALLPYRGRPLLEHAVAVLRAGGCGRVVVVLGAGATEVRAGARLDGCELVENPEWASGMGSSLRVGLGAVRTAEGGGSDFGDGDGDRGGGGGGSGGGDAVLVALVDTPGVTPEAVSRLLRAHAEGARLAAAAYGGKRAHPVLIGAEYWAEAVRGAVGDAGARALLAAHAAELALVECADVATADDIDTPEAWARWA